jgi:alpha-beta hydrolase superfamily lysophospholipase
MTNEKRHQQDASSAVHRHRWSPPEGAPVRSGGVYLLHGTGEHAARYERLAQRLAQNGWAVGAHDHPGHGRSGGPRGRIPIAGSLATRAAIEFARFENEIGTRPYLFGHSLGGVVACELVMLHRLPVAGLLLSAPAIVPHLSPRDALKLKLFSRLAPRTVIELPYDPSRLTHDPEQQQAALADPLIHGFKSAEFIGWLMQAATNVLEAADQLDVETLLMIAGADVIIDTDRTREFAQRAPQSLLSVNTYDDCHHELLNELPEHRERIESDIVRWLDERS